MPKPIDDFGDPEAVFCRHCDGGRVRLRGGHFCVTCDSPSPKPGLPVVVATWNTAA